MDNYFKGLIAILLSVATITGLIIWSIKEIIKKILQADSERQKNKLQLDYQKFNKLQNEQFETIKLIYSNLVKIDELLREAYEMVKDGQELGRSKIQNAFEPLMIIITDTERHFKQNSIVLTENICSKIELAINALIFCSTKSMYAVLVKSEDVYDKNGTHLGIQDKNVQKLSEVDKKDFYSIIATIEQVRQTEFKESLKALKIEFRALFGVTNKTTTNKWFSGSRDNDKT